MIASEVAMSTIVRFAVATRGSRIMPTPFETASMPVYVPPPSEYACMSSLSVAEHPERGDSSRPRSPCTSRRRRAGSSGTWPPIATSEQDGVRHEEQREDRRDRGDRLLHAAQVHQRRAARRPANVERRARRRATTRGRKLKIASAPAAIEIVIVRT